MLRSYLGSKGYTVYINELSSKERKKIREDLTFRPTHIEGYGVEKEPFCVLSKTKEKYFLPKCYGIKTFGPPNANKLEPPTAIDLKFKGKLRQNQIEPVQVCLQETKKKGGGILSLQCGAGKTVLSLYLISKLKVKTIVVVNKEFLVDQWTKSIQTFLPSAKIGKIQQKTADVYGKDIVIAMLHSVSKIDYSKSIFKGFGLAIYDEVHNIPTRIFSNSLRKIQTIYQFGLSATPHRKDGMTKLIIAYLGDIIYKSKNTKLNEKNVRVFSVQFQKLPTTRYYKPLLNFRKKPNVVKMISNLIECPLRLQLVVNVIYEVLRNEDRHLLVLSERIQYLKDIEEKILDRNPKFSIGYYVGGMKSKDREKSESCRLILASYKMAQEAMDIPILDTLFMVTSKSNIEQCVGRILRRKTYKHFPLVIDLVDTFSSFRSQFSKRKTFYKKRKYPIAPFYYDPLKQDDMLINMREFYRNATSKTTTEDINSVLDVIDIDE